MNHRHGLSSSARLPESSADSVAPAWGFRAKDWLFVIALTAAVILVYQPAWHGGVLWDDDAHITQSALRGWHGLYRIWFDVRATQQYYPLLHSAFWIEHRLWGDAPLGYHLANLLQHALAAVLVAFILRRLKIPGAYLAAAVFALHPIQVESVAWITEQKNTLSAVFYLGAMLTYLHFDESRKTPLYFGALALFLLGLLSKTVTATLPAALLVIFWWQRGGLSWRRDVLPLVPFFTIGAAAGVFTAWVERTLIGAEGAAFNLTPVDRCLIAGRAIWFYLGKLLWPADLLFIYPRWQVSQAVWWQYVFPLAALLMLIALWAMRRKWRGPLAGLLYFVGTLFPVLGFFNVFPFLYSFVADHFQYLAGLGIITLVSVGAALLLTRWRSWNRPSGHALCLVLLAVLAGLTWRQSRMYADAERLYRTTIAENPGCWMAYDNLGVVLVGRGQIDDAITCYRTALEIKSDYEKAHANLGVALAQKGRLDEAIAECQKSLDIQPNYAATHNNLGVFLANRQRMDEAIDHFQRALELDPAYAEARTNLDMARSEREGVRKALAAQRESLRSRPDDVALLNDAAWMLATNPNASIRNGAEAVELAQRAVELSDGREPVVLGTLAAAQAEVGQFAEAVKTAEQALTLALRGNDTALADALRARIKLYRSNVPYHEVQQPSSPSSGSP